MYSESTCEKTITGKTDKNQQSLHKNVLLVTLVQIILK